MDQGHKSAEYELRKKSPGLAALYLSFCPGLGRCTGAKS